MQDGPSESVGVPALPGKGNSDSTSHAASVNQTSAIESDEKNLLSETFSAEWLIYQSDSAAPSVWTLRKEPAEAGASAEELVLICSGEVKGYAYTKERFENFELTLDWRFPKDESGNSGVLVFTQAEPRIWPTSIQVQLHQPTAGSLIASGDSKFESIHEPETNLARPVNEWNECRILCEKGEITVEINGRKAGHIKAATPASGCIAIQSEGSEVHFRRIRLHRLETPASQTTEEQEASATTEESGEKSPSAS